MSTTLGVAETVSREISNASVAIHAHAPADLTQPAPLTHDFNFALPLNPTSKSSTLNPGREIQQRGRRRESPHGFRVYGLRCIGDEEQRDAGLLFATTRAHGQRADRTDWH